MSTKTEHICDKCGEEIRSETQRINIKGHLTIYGPSLEKDIEVSEDRCLDCAKESFEMNVLAIPIEPKSRADVEFEGE